MTTAAVWLECPVCEYRFSVPPDYADKSGKCPKCENVFMASDCQLPEKELVEEQSEPPIPLPAVLAEVAGATESSPNLVPPPAKASQNQNDDLEYDEDQTYVAVDKRRTDPNKVLIWVSASCLIAIGLLIGIPVLATMMVDRDKGGEKAQLTSNNPESNSKKGQNQSSNKGKSNKGGKRKKKNKKTAKPDRTIKNFTAEEYKKLWANCYTGIALVNAKFGTQNRMSHGVVFSNDGKIAVSLSQVAGADSVRVRFAKSEYGAKERWSKPIVANTILSSKPQLDLAIIKVDASTNPIAGRTQPIKFNDRGVIPTVSNAKSTEFFRLTKLRPAKPFDDLSDAEKEAIKSLSLEPESNDYFGFHSAKLNKSGIGAPVFDEEGLLVGMHLIHHAESKNSFLIPPGVIRKVLNDPRAKPRPISDSQPKKGLAKSPVKDSTTNVDATTFSAALESMSKLKWKYAAPIGFKTARRFSERWWDVNAEYSSADFTRKNRIDELKERMRSEMDEQLFWPARADAQVVNRAAVKSFRDKERGWFAAVTIVKPAGLAKDVNGEPSILVRLNEINENALLIPGEVEGPFLPGGEWLIFGINKDNTRLNTADGKCMVIHLAGVKKK